MSKTVRPRRSVLYMPGANTRALEKARSLPADALIFDLEDAVAPDAKEAARTNVVLAAQSKAYGKREIVIRCNGLATEWGAADIEAIATSGADAILVPKVESAAEVTHVVSLLDTAGAPADHGGVGDDGNAQGHPARRGDRRLPSAARTVRHGHQRSGEGHAGAPHADAPAVDDGARPRHAGGASLRAHHPRRRLQRHPRRRGIPRRLPAGAGDGVRRQDPDPSRARSSRATRSSRPRPPNSRWPARSSPPSGRRRPKARAWSRSTAG